MCRSHRYYGISDRDVAKSLAHADEIDTNVDHSCLESKNTEKIMFGT